MHSDAKEINAYMQSPRAVSLFSPFADEAGLASKITIEAAEEGPEPSESAAAVRLQGGGVRVGYWCASQRMAVWIAIAPSRFLLDFERSNAWGLDPNQDLVVKIEFDSLYLESSDMPRVTAVRQAPTDTDLNRSDITDTSSCGLEWAIKDKVNGWLKSSWQPSILSRSLISEVVECSGSEPVAAVEALVRSVGDKSEAINLLLDQDRAGVMMADLAADANIALSLPTRFHGKPFDSSPNLRAFCRRLRGLYPGAPGEAVLRAVEVCGSPLQLPAAPSSTIITSHHNHNHHSQKWLHPII